jgi:succinate dehydrogenase / fumarate reductase flavoprotein subunit
MNLNAKIPSGPLADKWSKYKSTQNLVNPANKRKFDIIVVGTGLAGASAAASLGELGFKVKNFCYQDSPRRAHSIAAQGGINAAKNYQNDGDSVYRLFYDTIKGGDYRAREANVYRLAEVSNQIIDQCVGQGVPFARDYGGYLDNRSFGGALVSRTFYARGQTGQQLLLGAYGALNRQIAAGNVTMYTRTEMMDVVLVDGVARGIVTRNLETGALESHFGHAVVLATGGYGNVFFLSTNAMGSNTSAIWKAYKKGASFANPAFVQIHPTCIPVHGASQSKLTLMSESLRNDGRIWVPKEKEDAEKIRAGKLKPTDLPDEKRDYYLERRYPAFGNLVPRDVASRAAKERCDAGYGVGSGQAVYLDFKDSIKRLGKNLIEERYGNLFQMYEKIVDENPYQTPMMIYPAIHYTMGGLWVDYELMTTIPGLFTIGEANFSDHGANRLGASALMQGLADGYFVLPFTIQNYLASQLSVPRMDPAKQPEFGETVENSRAWNTKLMGVKGSRSVDSIHKELGLAMWDHVGMGRNKAGLEKGITKIRQVKDLFWNEVRIPGKADSMNIELEKANRVADFLELGELLAKDALHREESCGGHFREEHAMLDGEAKRDDENFKYVGAWEYAGPGKEPILNKEPLDYEFIQVKTRNYKE